MVYFRGWDATCDVRHTYLWIESPYQASRSQRVKQQYVCVSQVEMSFTKLPKYALVRKEIWFRLYSSTGRFTELAAPDVSVNAESRLSKDLKASAAASELRLSRAAEKAEERARIHVSDVKAELSRASQLSADDLKVYTTASELRLSAERKDSELRLSRAAEKADERARVNVSEIKAEFSNFKRLLFGSVVSCVVSLAVQANSTGKNTRDAEPSGWVRWGRSWFEADGVREKE